MPRGIHGTRYDEREWGRVTIAGFGMQALWLLNPHDGLSYNFDWNNKTFTIEVSVLPTEHPGKDAEPHELRHGVRILEDGVVPVKPDSRDWRMIWKAFRRHQMSRLRRAGVL